MFTKDQIQSRIGPLFPGLMVVQIGDVDPRRSGVRTASCAPSSRRRSC
ncbi:MAG: hypothetical protein ABI589_05970 [Burkholderiales bacterium]